MTKDNDLVKRLREPWDGGFSRRMAEELEAANRIEELEAEKDWYRDHIVWGFYEEGEPKYYQGKAGEHEICDPVTAKEVTCLLSKLNNAEAELASGSFYKESDIDKMQESIKALTEQLEDARLDAKEAEVYSVWLEGKLATCEKYRDAYAECDRIGTQAVRDLEAKLAKAMETLQSVINACDQGRMIPRPGHGAGGMTIEANVKGSIYTGVPAWPIEEARTALAELKGDKT